MQHDRFVGLVQDRAQLGARDAAESATRATLETLGARLDAGMAENLAAQLPPEIGLHLREADDQAEPFGLDEFRRRLAQRETSNVDEATAESHARVVFSVVEEAITGDALDRARQQLPPEFSELFEFGAVR